MIYLYSGTPGSGKSLHLARDIMFKLRRGQNVIANFLIDVDVVRSRFFGLLRYKNLGAFIYKPDREFTVDFLVDYAKKNHKAGLEGQTLVCFDEAQRKWNSAKNRISSKEIEKWEDFFSLHRHLGFNIILCTQKDKMIDRYLRDLLEYDIKHRKANNRGTIGMFLPFKLFSAVTYWYGVREKLSVEFFTYRKLYSILYDSYSFSDDTQAHQADVLGIFKSRDTAAHGEGPA